MRICVLLGGTSAEREVSLASGVQVARALREWGHSVTAVDTSRGVLEKGEEEAILARGVEAPPSPTELEYDLLSTGDLRILTEGEGVRGSDLIFPILHGGTGEDGTLQTLLDVADLPYAGSGRLGCALAMDKEISKRLFRDEGIPTPDWMSWDPSDPREAAGGREPDLDRVVECLGLPMIVKPPSGGSTVGLTLAHDEAELAEAVEESLRHEARVLFEAYVRGRELTVGIVGRDALPVGEIVPAHELFDYECKYQPGMAEEIFPAGIPDALAVQLQDLALRAHGLLRLSDFSRVDFIVDEAGTPWCLEANALPGMTANSLLPKAARAAEISFPELCDRIVQEALARRSAGVARSGT